MVIYSLEDDLRSPVPAIRVVGCNHPVGEALWYNAAIHIPSPCFGPSPLSGSQKAKSSSLGSGWVFHGFIWGSRLLNRAREAQPSSACTEGQALLELGEGHSNEGEGNGYPKRDGARIKKWKKKLQDSSTGTLFAYCQGVGNYQWLDDWRGGRSPNNKSLCLQNFFFFKQRQKTGRGTNNSEMRYFGILDVVTSSGEMARTTATAMGNVRFFGVQRERWDWWDRGLVLRTVVVTLD